MSWRRRAPRERRGGALPMHWHSEQRACGVLGAGLACQDQTLHLGWRAAGMQPAMALAGRQWQPPAAAALAASELLCLPLTHCTSLCF